MLRIVFFGSDDFAVVHLEELLRAGFPVAACVTPPDQPRGRGLKTVLAPVAECARKAGIPLLQPDHLRDPVVEASLRSYGADVFVVIAYGKFLPGALLALPRNCALNVHGSLLPQYRGAAPINWAVINGETTTGISVIRMNARMDAGDIVAQARINILPDENAAALRDRMAALGAQTLLAALSGVERGTVTLTPQDEHQVTLAPKLTKDLGLIHWDDTAAAIHNRVRGLLPWPCCFTFWQGKMVKVLQTQVRPQPAHGQQPGTIVAVEPAGLRVAAGQGEILLKQVLPQSSRPMDAASFARGHGAGVGGRFQQA